MQELYTSLCALLDKLEVYQLFVVDIVKMREYQEELAMATSKVSFNPIASQIRRKILDSDTMPSLSTTFS